ncbi:major core protein 4b [Fadolivirus algeromassiliense]|jgi:hypothetical protein|uniref:Major core protein 4b n=1 Tax=Fadolivirus FV1/VV64 TaxID=3070911 RepID=A0A7D3V5D9_9VIRU|nr:major core protein 4b [Fadolivirus algeromassiliense]QKF93875.1 major core protein 4b [Fadolivirus FV1/VV64]
MSEQKSFNRDTRGDDFKSHQKDGAVDREVAELLKSQATDYQAWQKLKAKFPNNADLVEKVMDAYKDKLQYIFKKAKKFKQVLYDRYAGLNLPVGELMRKAKKYQRKYKLSEAEFDMFQILVLTDKSSKYMASVPTTKIAKTLGYDSLLAASSKLNVKPDEQSMVEEIVNKYGETKPLHAQVLLQSLTYEDCAPSALMGKFDASKHNAFAHIHPIVAALFLPKIDLLEQNMIMANIGYIVQRKATEQQIATWPDFCLYWNMVTDPNDTACNITNPVVDLKNRFILQTQLWDAVLNLRQGRYYYQETSGLVRFMTALENCRNVIHDAPDLTYVKDEGTILRRLLSAFSLYPTYVSVNRLWGLLVGTQLGQPSSPYDATGYGAITRVPMITLRLPLNITGMSAPVSLRDSLSQAQWFVENKVIVPKSVSIIHSTGVLFFYVGRRFQTLNIARLANPFNFTNLPMTVTGWESLNTHPVDVPRDMTFMNDYYELRSVVLVEKTSAYGRDLIVGSSTMVITPRTTTSVDDVCFHYDPQRSAYGILDQTATGGPKYERDDPVRVIPSHASFAATGIESFDERARTRGTIFMYQKVTDNANPFFSN